MARTAPFGILVILLVSCFGLSLGRLLVPGDVFVATEEEFDVFEVAEAGPEAGGPKEHACEICRQAAAELLVILSDPATVEQAIAILQGALCSNVPGPLLEKCTELVRTYVPQAVVILQEKLNPDVMCVSTRICTPPDNVLELVSSRTVEVTPQCDICVQVASQILLLLESGKTQEQILAFLHNACSKIKAPGVTEKCDKYVDLYFVQLIALLGTVTPEEACHLAHYCAAGQALSPSAKLASDSLPLQIEVMKLVGSTPQECAACRFLVSQAKKKLKDPDNQVKLVVFLTDACNRVPDYVDQCKQAVLEYLPVLFANIDSIVDPAKVCAKVNLCPTNSWVLNQLDRLSRTADS